MTPHMEIFGTGIEEALGYARVLLYPRLHGLRKPISPRRSWMTMTPGLLSLVCCYHRMLLDKWSKVDGWSFLCQQTGLVGTMSMGITLMGVKNLFLSSLMIFSLVHTYV